MFRPDGGGLNRELRLTLTYSHAMITTYKTTANPDQVPQFLSFLKEEYEKSKDRVVSHNTLSHLKGSYFTSRSSMIVIVSAEKTTDPDSYVIIKDYFLSWEDFENLSPLVFAIISSSSSLALVSTMIVNAPNDLIKKELLIAKSTSLVFRLIAQENGSFSDVTIVDSFNSPPPHREVEERPSVSASALPIEAASLDPSPSQLPKAKFGVSRLLSHLFRSLSSYV